MDRALSSRGERHLVLDYLLRFPMKDLVEKYGIPRATIYRILARHEVSTDRKAMP
jgi:hypothetical protein